MGAEEVGVDGAVRGAQRLLVTVARSAVARGVDEAGDVGLDGPPADVLEGGPQAPAVRGGQEVARGGVAVDGLGRACGLQDLGGQGRELRPPRLRSRAVEVVEQALDIPMAVIGVGVLARAIWCRRRSTR